VPTKTKKRPAMTATEARSFNSYSPANAGMIGRLLQCGCQPYENVFTYRRWKAQGYQVQKGEKAIKIPVIKTIPPKEDADPEAKPRSFKGSSAVFCRCQVKPIKEQSHA